MIKSYLIIFIASFILINSIHLLWKLINDFSTKTSTGSGYGLSIIFLFVSYFEFSEKFFLFFLFFIMSTLYFIDDLKKLDFKIRIFLQIILSIIIFLYLDNYNNYSILILIVLVFSSILLTNSINFNDGSDLNISLLFIIYLILFLFNFHNESIFNTYLIISTLIYLFIFSFFNIKKISYFGDSGCYAITFLLLILTFDEFNLQKLGFLIICFSYYLIDTFTFLLIRLRKKENLLTRNYYHLYQNMEINYGRYLYLLPGPISIIILTLFFNIYNNFDFTIQNIIMILVFNFFYYFFLRFIFYK